MTDRGPLTTGQVPLLRTDNEEMDWIYGVRVADTLNTQADDALTFQDGDLWGLDDGTTKSWILRTAEMPRMLRSGE